MRFVQLLLTDEQAELLAACARDAEIQLKEIAAKSEFPADDPAAEDAVTVGRLSMLLQDAAEQPAKYTPTGKTAATVRTIVRRAKGTAQPQSRKNKRKARQEERQRTSKVRRHYRKQIAQAWNESREKLEAEKQAAAEKREQDKARWATQPKFKVVLEDGTEVLGEIPAEFVVNEETGENLALKVIVPGA